MAFLHLRDLDVCPLHFYVRQFERPVFHNLRLDRLRFLSRRVVFR